MKALNFLSPHYLKHLKLEPRFSDLLQELTAKNQIKPKHSGYYFCNILVLFTFPTKFLHSKKSSHSHIFPLLTTFMCFTCDLHYAGSHNFSHSKISFANSKSHKTFKNFLRKRLMATYIQQKERKVIKRVKSRKSFLL